MRLKLILTLSLSLLTGCAALCPDGFNDEGYLCINITVPLP